MLEVALALNAATLVAVVALAILFVARGRSAGASRDVGPRLDALDRSAERLERSLSDELGKVRKEAGDASRDLRAEVAASMKDAREGMQGAVGALSTNVLGTLAHISDLQMKQIGDVGERIRQLNEENAKQLEQMRQVVDEKLEGTLERRLGESFKLVNDQLEQVHAGLGEMRNLAGDVGDLKRVLTNVVTRGAWGEVRLGALLDQILTPDQYDTNVQTKATSAERVEYAVKLPGRGAPDEVVWLPIDAKFPNEDYERLIDASQRGDAVAVEAAAAQLETRVRASAKTIREKYLNPPQTTPFAIMFLPTEGLYAEVLRRPGVVEGLKREYDVLVAGPTTVAAILSSLQVGFRTLAIEKRSTEVWRLLGAVKTEFGKYGDVLRRVQAKLSQASDTVESAMTRARVVQRKLGQVEQLPLPESESLLAAEEPLVSLQLEAEGDSDEDEAFTKATEATDLQTESRVRHCVNCGREFEAPHQRGRPPVRCGECRGLAAGIAPSEELMDEAERIDPAGLGEASGPAVAPTDVTVESSEASPSSSD